LSKRKALEVEQNLASELPFVDYKKHGNTLMLDAKLKKETIAPYGFKELTQPQECTA